MGCFRGSDIENVWKSTNGCTDWHQICHTSADSCGNGHRLKTISPPITQGAIWGVLGGHKMQKPGKSTKRLDRLAPHLQNICRFIWEWTYRCMLTTISPSIPKGGLWGFIWSKMQNSGKSTKGLDRLAPNFLHVCGFIWEWT